MSNARDPFSVKPAQLPSMGGATPTQFVVDPAGVAQVVSSAGSPRPPAEEPHAPRGRRPQLRVTNGWTGAYQVEKAGAPGAPHAPHVGAQPRAFREQAASLRHQVHARTMSPRRAAREQVKAARARAREIQRRTRSHLRRRDVEHGPAPVLAVLAVMMVMGGVFLVMKVSKRSASVTSSQGLVAVPFALSAPPAE